jgi:hypothetical protein
MDVNLSRSTQRSSFGPELESGFNPSLGQDGPDGGDSCDDCAHSLFAAPLRRGAKNGLGALAFPNRLEG